MQTVGVGKRHYEISTDRVVEALSKRPLGATADLDIPTETIKAIKLIWDDTIKTGRVFDFSDIPEKTAEEFVTTGNALYVEEVAASPFRSWISIGRYMVKKRATYITLFIEEGASVVMININMYDHAFLIDHVGAITIKDGDFYSKTAMCSYHPDDENGENREKISMLQFFNAIGALNTRGIAWQERKPTYVRGTGDVKRPGRIRPKPGYFTKVSASKSHGKRTDKTYPGRKSPRPHHRRGTTRHYANGNKKWIRPCMVNVASPDELAFLERKGYRVGHGKMNSTWNEGD